VVVEILQTLARNAGSKIEMNESRSACTATLDRDELRDWMSKMR